MTGLIIYALFNVSLAALVVWIFIKGFDNTQTSARQARIAEGIERTEMWLEKSRETLARTKIKMKEVESIVERLKHVN